MRVLKFGGTSVGTPENMRRVYEIVTVDHTPKIIVLSALSGVTNALENIGDSLIQSNTPEAEKGIADLEAHHRDFIDKLFEEAPSREELLEKLKPNFEAMRRLLTKEYKPEHGKLLLAQGELLSTSIFSQYLHTMGVKNALLPALDFMAINDLDEPDLPFIQKSIKEKLRQHPRDNCFITQGYICMNARGQVDNLKRGGSDYTASLLGAAIQAEEVQIWTDIDGMHNNDPRVVKNTAPVAEISFNEASELAYFGAKILHPSSILPASKYNIPVRLKNTMRADAPGTIISSVENAIEAKAIAAKDGITAIKIKSSRMLLAYGFLKKIFEVFEKYQTPIDMITTSEVAVSLSIDNDSRLSDIMTELKPFGEITIDHKQTIICIVGNRIVEKPGIISKIFRSLENIPVRMISYGGSKYNVSVLIDGSHKSEALNALHKHLFEPGG